MKKTLTAMAIVTSMLPLSNTSSADNENDLSELNADNSNKIDSKEDSILRISKDSLSATVVKNNSYLIDSNGNKVEPLKIGDKLQILKRFTEEPFTKVQYNGRALFIANDAINTMSVSNTSGTDFTLTSFAKVINVKSGDTLNVRSSDSTTGSILFTLKPNTGVNVYERTKNGWYKIEYYGNYGYVNSKYIQLTNPIVSGKTFNGYAQTLSKLSAKELPCSSSNSLFDMPLHAGVHITEKTDNNWYKIKYYDKVGYISSNDLKILSYEEPTKPNFTVTPMNNIWSKIVCSSKIDGKKYPSSDSLTMYSLANGAGVYITGETSNGWYELKYYNDTIYVPKTNVQSLIPTVTVTDFKMNGVVYNLKENSKLNVRKQANDTSAIITALYNNDKVKVTGKTSNNWYRLDITGIEGYVPKTNIKEFIEESKPSFTVSALYMDGVVYDIASDDVLNVRATPYYDGTLITSLKNNTRVKITGVTSNDWYQVDINGKTGYVNKRYIKEYIPKTTKYKVINGAINLRTSASWSGEAYETVSVGTVLDVIEINNGWASIYKDKKTLYAPANYLESLDNPPAVVPTPPIVTPTPPAVEEPKPSFTVSSLQMDGVVYNIASNDVLNVRETPYYDGALITSLKNNTRVKITGVTSNDWYQVDINGKTGYASKSYIKEYIPETTKYKVINGAINLRTSASWSGEAYETVSVGTILNVIEINGDWASIYKDKKTLYAPANYLESLDNPPAVVPTPPVVVPTPPVVEEPKPSFTVSSLQMDGIVYNVASNDVLNVRATPYYDGTLIAELKNNNRIKVTGLTSNGWYQVDINGKIGYANKNYIKEYIPETTKYKVINGAINLRTSASWSGEAYETVSVGTVIDVIEINNGWASIYKDKKTLYAPANYLESLDNPPVVVPTPPVVEPTPPAVEEPKPSFTVSALQMDGIIYNIASDDVLNIRETPYSTGTLITSLKNNTRVKVTGLTSNGWYQVNINGKTGYASKSYIKEYIPETTKYKVINGAINLRTSASWSGEIYEVVSVGATLDVIEINGDWASIYKDKKTLYAPVSYLTILNQESNTVYTKYSYSLNDYINLQYNANKNFSVSDYENYIHPLTCNKFEFLRLDKFINLDLNKVNNMLLSQNAGVLIGKGQAFLDVAKKYNINPLYFIAQSLHETGYGKSTLAKGVTITEIADTTKPIKDSNGNITGYVMIPLANPTTVYNLYGIGAQDNLPTMPNRALILGTTYAYNKGWTSIEKALDGAGEFVSSNYIHNSKYNQNTIYKFRFNPNSTYIWHQYATTLWYSRDIAKFMDKYQDFYIEQNFTFDKPLFDDMQEYSLPLAKSLSTENYLSPKEDITLK